MLGEKAMVNLFAKEMKKKNHFRLIKKKKTTTKQPRSTKKHFHSSTLPKGYQLVTSVKQPELKLSSFLHLGVASTSEIQPIQRWMLLYIFKTCSSSWCSYFCHYHHSTIIQLFQVKTLEYYLISIWIQNHMDFTYIFVFYATHSHCYFYSRFMLSRHLKKLPGGFPWWSHG